MKLRERGSCHVWALGLASVSMALGCTGTISHENEMALGGTGDTGDTGDTGGTGGTTADGTEPRGDSALPPPADNPWREQGETTFEEVCAHPTTVNCWGFEDESRLFYTWNKFDPRCADDPFLKNHPNGRNTLSPHRQDLGNVIAKVRTSDGECVYPKATTEHATSGERSLKLRFVDRTPDGMSNPSGNFNVPFKRIGTKGNFKFAQLGAGGEIWIRFSIRQNRALVTFDPANPLPLMVGGNIAKPDKVFPCDSSRPLAEDNRCKITAIKRLIVEGGKSDITEVMTDGGRSRQPNIYGKGGAGSENSEPQEGHPLGDLAFDQWQTYQLHIKLADNADYSNGVLELFIDDHPEPVIQDLARSNSPGAATMQSEPYTEDADLSQKGYYSMDFNLFTTDMIGGQVNPLGEGAMWIDDVVVSHFRVPTLLHSE